MNFSKHSGIKLDKYGMYNSFYDSCIYIVRRKTFFFLLRRKVEETKTVRQLSSILGNNVKLQKNMPNFTQYWQDFFLNLIV